MTLDPIFYRHWLELRYRILGAAIFGFLGVLAYFAFIQSALGWLRQTGKIVEELKAAQYLVPVMGPERLIAWGLHVQFLSLVIASAAFALWDFTRVESWTLSLPISRNRIYATRIIASWCAILGIGLSMTVLNILTLAVLGEAIPVREMLGTSLILSLLSLPVFAVRMLLTLSTALATLFMVTVPFLAVVYGWPALSQLLFNRVNSWLAVATALPLTAILFAASQWIARRRDQ